MCVEDLNNVLSSGSIANLGACDTFTDIPVSSPEGSRAAVEGILEHGALLDRPATEDG